MCNMKCKNCKYWKFYLSKRFMNKEDPDSQDMGICSKLEEENGNHFFNVCIDSNYCDSNGYKGAWLDVVETGSRFGCIFFEEKLDKQDNI